MSGLVGYGSSDEDEAEAQPVLPVNVPSMPNRPQDEHPPFANGTNDAKISGNGQASDTTKEKESPMLGPSMPKFATLEGYEDGVEVEVEDELPPMSEPDLLRYLTQPAHPMTSLPPEPSLSADPAVSARFQRFLELKAKGIHFNKDLGSKSSFKNPNLFASLLERADLPPEAQYASTVPTDIFTLDMFPPWAYKEELLRTQQALNDEHEASRKAQSANGRRTIDFTSSSHDENQSRESTSGLQAKRKRP